MKKRMISLISAAAITLTMSTSAWASPGTVERSVNLRSAPSTDSSVYQTLKPGTAVDIISQVNSYWYKISVGGKVGYASTDYISGSASSGGTTATIERGVNFRSAPSTDSRVYRLLKAGTQVQVLEKVNSYWLHISVDGQTGYVSTDYVSGGSSPAPAPNPSPSVPSSAKADRIIAHAQALIGKVRYDFGVNRPTSVMDCSAFTKYVFGLEGVSMKWGTRFQKDMGSFVSKSSLQKGDLVFFWTGTRGVISHVGIYMGNGQFIHNSPSFDGVGTSSLNSGYWEDHYVTARRVL
ncbi:C40 family peptidase [Paenibacillus flagellatus]|nr:C40 family peptidase [Paenibacillus flagellatus]